LDRLARIESVGEHPIFLRSLLRKIGEERTVSIVRVGTTKKYAEGWAAAFGGKKKPAASTKKTTSRKRAAGGRGKK
jgi:hypothetical protein